MMNADTKKHIDAARQVLVGVVPNPASQIDQITNALIYKFMDDMDRESIKAGGEPSFFLDNLEEYSWTKLMSPRIGNQERMNLYSEALVKFSQSTQLPDLFRDIFKSAFLPYRSPDTLGLFLKEISYFDYSHPEELGNAYEYLLSIMSSQGDAGQFRTPRHIIDFMVDVINPSKDDKILDPACGTGGFLVSSYKHILEHHDGKNDQDKKEKLLTPDDRRKLVNNFEGYDVDPGMVRISQVNMYLHQFKSPKIFQYNTLSMEDRWNDKFDIILANPPFMSPKGGVSTHNRFSISSGRSEVLFVDYIMNHLRPKGKAAVIVPEGIIFQSGTAHKQLRKNIVEDGLYTVVSLPSGVFNPYAGVKTSILFFNNELAKQSSEILFIKIESDGYDLGAQRRLINKNDLPLALEVMNKWNIGEKVENKLVAYVEKSKIAESGDYNLSGDRYRVAIDYSNVKWPMVKLDDIFIEIKNGKNVKQIDEVGKYRVSRIQTIATGEVDLEKTKYTNDKVQENDFLKEGDILFSHINSIDHLAKTAIFENTKEKVVHGTNLIRLRPDLNKIVPKFSLYQLKHELFIENARRFAQKAVNQASINSTAIRSFQIPLPPLEIQEQIVKELDGYSGIISGAKQIVQNWKPKIDIDPEWKKVKLDEVLNRVSEQVDPQKNTGDVFYVGLENIEPQSGRIVGNPISKYENIKSLKNSFKVDDLLYGKLRPNLNKVWLADRKGICSTDILVFRSKENTLANFYWYLLLSNDFVKEVMAGIKGAQLPRVGIEHLKNLVLPFPPYAIQKQIVEKIEAERVLVESAKKLIMIYEQKSKETIGQLWKDENHE